MSTAPLQIGFAAIALPLAAKNIPTTPVLPNSKKAILIDWPVSATTNVDQIMVWDRLYPGYNGAAVARAEVGGFWFWEVDDKAVLDRIESETGKKIPDTFRVRSRPGRGHYYFKHNARSIAMGNISQTYVKHADWSARVDHQYVVAPGSIHPNSQQPYIALQEEPINEAPDWLVDWLISQKVSKDTTAKEFKLDDRGLIPHGQIHGWLLTQAGRMRAMGMQAAEIEPALLRMTHEQCAPPIDESKVKTMAHSVCNSFPPGVSKDLLLTQTAAPAPAAAPVEWPPIIPVDVLLQPVSEFKPEYLPRVVRAWAMDVSRRMGVPLDFTGVCMLVTLAGMTGRRVFVHPKEHDKEWKESITISGCVISPSGTIKTPTWDASINPAIEKESDWRKQAQQSVAIYLGEKKRYNDSVKANKKDPKVELLPEPVEPSPARRLVVNDATPEKIQEILMSNPEGVLFYRDELSSWAAEMEKPGYENQKGLFLTGMSGNSRYTIDRIGRGEISAKMCISVFGAFQPGLLKEFLNSLNNTEDGTTQRFTLMVWPDVVKMPLVDLPVDVAAKTGFRALIRALSEMTEESAWLHFDAEAQQDFNGWLAALQDKIARTDEGALRSHFSKYSGAVAKLAALYQLVDLIELGGSVKGHYKIDAEHLDMATQMFDHYLEGHARRVYGCILPAAQRAELDITALITGGKLSDAFSARDVLRRSRPLQKLKIDAIEMALENLADKGWLRQSPPSNTAGRPTARWAINPAAVTNK